MAFPTGWLYYKVCTIDHNYVGSTLTDFPLLAKNLSDSDLSAHALANGNDIRFSSDSNTPTEYPFGHIGTFSSGNLLEKLKVPSISAVADTKFRVWYGNPFSSDGQQKSSVYNSTYKGVLSLDESPGGSAPQFDDWTTNNNDATVHGTIVQSTGKVGKGIEIGSTDTNAYALITGAASNHLGSVKTWGATVSIANKTIDHAVMGIWDSNGGAGNFEYFTVYEHTADQFLIANGSNGGFGAVCVDSLTGTLSTNTFYHVVGRADSGTLSIFVNGQKSSASYTGALNSGTKDLYLGQNNDVGYLGVTPLQGVLDEVFIAGYLSDDWINFDYQNQFNNRVSYAAQQSAVAWLGTWKYRKAIKYGSTKPASTLTDFHLLIKISTDSDLGSALGATPKLAFTAADGITPVNHGRVSWSYSSGSVTANIRAKFNLASTASTGDVIGYIYYDSAQTDTENKSGVLDSSTKLYMPLDDIASGLSNDITDWTSNANHGTSNGSIVGAITGQVYNGERFDGSNDYINCPHTSSLNIGGASAPITISALINWGGSSSADAYNCIVSKEQGGGIGNGYTLLLKSNGKLAFYLTDASSNVSIDGTGAALSTNVWTQVVGVYDGTNISTYINGSVDATSAPGAFTWGTNSTSLRIGGNSVFGTGRYLPADLDELVISNVARSGNWISFDYQNQFNNSNTVTLGSQEPFVSGAINGSSSLSGSLTVNNGVLSLAGIINAVSTLGCSPDVVPLGGSLSHLDGEISVLRGIIGNINGNSTLSGNILCSRKLAGSIDGASQLVGSLDVVSIAGPACGFRSMLAPWLGGAEIPVPNIVLSGTIDAVSSLSANLTRSQPASSQIDGNSNLEGNLNITQEVSCGYKSLLGFWLGGASVPVEPPNVIEIPSYKSMLAFWMGGASVPVSADISGSINGLGNLTGSFKTSCSISGKISSISAIGSEVYVVSLGGSHSDLDGNLTVLRSLSGNIAVTSAVGSEIYVASGGGVHSSLDGQLSVSRAINGTIFGVSTLVGSLDVLGEHEIRLVGNINSNSAVGSEVNLNRGNSGESGSSSNLNNTINLIRGLASCSSSYSSLGLGVLLDRKLTSRLSVSSILSGNLTVFNPTRYEIVDFVLYMMSQKDFILTKVKQKNFELSINKPTRF